jgi:hypothetical protein
MSSEKEVSSFLKEFNVKLGIWDILYRDDRGKNMQALVDLELRPIDRKNVLKSLDTKDFSQGPIEEKLYGGSDMWVFGKTIKKRELYIKITIGAPGSSVICISFHLAEYKMQYPLK